MFYQLKLIFIGKSILMVKEYSITKNLHDFYQPVTNVINDYQIQTFFFSVNIIFIIFKIINSYAKKSCNQESWPASHSQSHWTKRKLVN